MSDWKKLGGGILIFVFPIAAGLTWHLISDSSLIASPQSLIDPNTRLKSFHKRWLKTKSADQSYSKNRRHFRNFEAGHNEIRMLKVPIPNQSEIYLILRGR